jgi:hypothetical protein
MREELTKYHEKAIEKASEEIEVTAVIKNKRAPK